jgi:hypothetical protein
MKTKTEAGDTQAAPDEYVPDPLVAKEFSVTLMTLWKWDHDERLAFPPPVMKIRGRNYRSRRAIEEFKTKMISRGMRSERAA